MREKWKGPRRGAQQQPNRCMIRPRKKVHFNILQISSALSSRREFICATLNDSKCSLFASDASYKFSFSGRTEPGTMRDNDSNFFRPFSPSYFSDVIKYVCKCMRTIKTPQSEPFRPRRVADTVNAENMISYNAIEFLVCFVSFRPFRSFLCAKAWK